MNKLLTSIIIVMLSLHVTAQQFPLIQNTGGRNPVSLNGTWKMIIDPLETGYYDYRYMPMDRLRNPGGNAFFTNQKPANKTDRIEYDFDKDESLMVPGDWNSQKEKLLYYEGTIWYRKMFNVADLNTDKRYFIWFGAANYRADVYLNGKKLGVHIGGFTPFNFEVTGMLKETDNFLIVKVDDKRSLSAVPTINFDWWNYGGLTRDVKLLETEGTFIEDYRVGLDEEDPNNISTTIVLNGNDKNGATVGFEIPELGLKEMVKTDEEGMATLRLSGKKVTRWSPENPKLYEVLLYHNNDTINDRIGFRTIETQGTKILLNGKEIFLKGISIHAENPLKQGRATIKEDAALLLNWAKELGCNFVRLAHYPHTEHMIKLADEMGILVWEENPVYWTIDWTNEDTYANAENQLSEVMSRDKNRACVIIWSMANETPLSDERLAFLSNLADKARSLDDTRLISAALEIHYQRGADNLITIDDPFAERRRNHRYRP